MRDLGLYIFFFDDGRRSKTTSRRYAVRGSREAGRGFLFTTTGRSRTSAWMIRGKDDLALAGLMSCL